MRAFLSDFGMLIGEGISNFPVLIYNQFISEVMEILLYASALAIDCFNNLFLFKNIFPIVPHEFSPSEPKNYKRKMAAIYVTVWW